MRWLFGCAALLVLALALFAVPAGVEGRDLVPISPGHALSLVDAVALVPLLGGFAVLAIGLWRRREHLGVVIKGAPWPASTVSFAAGIGLGLLLASVFPFFWWWAIGAALFTAVLAVVTLLAAKSDPH